MEKLGFASRLLLGLIYFAFGLNGFFQFLPMKPPPLPQAAMAFVGGLMQSGYFMPLLSGTQVVGGFLLLTGLAAPFALVILAPVTLNILLFHLFLTPGLQNLWLALVLTFLQVVAMAHYARVYRPLFSRR